MRMQIHRSRAGFTLIELLTVIAIIGILAALITPRFWLARESAAYSACGQNLKSLATALQIYQNDYGRNLPSSLSVLNPGYLGSLPTCPMAGSDTYSSGYTKNDNPQCFTIFCQGTFHRTVGHSPDQPWYTMDAGLGP